VNLVEFCVFWRTGLSPYSVASLFAPITSDFGVLRIFVSISRDSTRVSCDKPALPFQPLSTTHWQPVLLGRGSSAKDQDEDDVDGSAHTSENEERDDGDADQGRDIESADHSDHEKDSGTSERENRDDGVC
jgi:hypothetical protein